MNSEVQPDRRLSPDGAAQVAEKHRWTAWDVRFDLIRDGLDAMNQS